MRRKIFYAGVLSSLVGIILLLSSFFSLTGLAILSGANSKISSMLSLILLVLGILLINFSKYVRLASRIGSDNGLVRLAEEATENQAVQRDVNHLIKELAKGNTNPGLGSKNLFGNIYYLRGRNGGRVFYREIPNKDGYEILAKSSKYNEESVADRLESIYGKQRKKKTG